MAVDSFEQIQHVAWRDEVKQNVLSPVHRRIEVEMTELCWSPRLSGTKFEPVAVGSCIAQVPQKLEQGLCPLLARMGLCTLNFITD